MNHNFIIVNCDTDSISFRKEDGFLISNEEQEQLLNEINSLMPKMIEFGHDGYYEKVIVLKAKNYILFDGKKLKKKGSSIKDSKREPAIKEMIDKVIKDLVHYDGKNILSIYLDYVEELKDIKDITRWCGKKSITNSVLNPTRTNEQMVYDLIKSTNEIYQEGDKIYAYFAIDGEKQKSEKGELVFYKDGRKKMTKNKILKFPKQYNKDIDIEHYLKRLLDTLKIFENVIDIKQFPKFKEKDLKND